MSSDDLHRTNINLLKSDVAYLRDLLGFGWTEKVREIVQQYVRHARKGGGLDADASLCFHCLGTGKFYDPSKPCLSCNGTGRQR